MEVHRSALKHGVAPQDAVYAAQHAVFAFNQQEDQPHRQLRLGFDPAGSWGQGPDVGGRQRLAAVADGEVSRLQWR